jgi:hypothetical protein
MKTNLKKLQVAGATLAVAVAGTGAAFAATHGSSSGAAASSTSRTVTTGALGGPPGRGGFGVDLAAAASYLGTTKAKLQAQLRSGTTLAKIASSTSGKSTAGLIDAIVAAEKKRLTSTQQKGMLSGLTQRVTAFVNGTRPSGAPPGRGGGKPPTTTTSK